MHVAILSVLAFCASRAAGQTVGVTQTAAGSVPNELHQPPPVGSVPNVHHQPPPVGSVPNVHHQPPPVGSVPNVHHQPPPVGSVPNVHHQPPPVGSVPNVHHQPPPVGNVPNVLHQATPAPNVPNVAETGQPAVQHASEPAGPLVGNQVVDDRLSEVRFEVYHGYLNEGGDVLQKTMTADQAKVVCASMPPCKGFTFQGAGNKNEAHNIYFKTDWLFNPADGSVPATQRSTSYKKVFAPPVASSPATFVQQPGTLREFPPWVWRALLATPLLVALLTLIIYLCRESRKHPEVFKDGPCAGFCACLQALCCCPEKNERTLGCGEL